MKADVNLDARTQPAGDVLGDGAVHDFLNGKVFSVGVLTVEERGGDPGLVGHQEIDLGFSLHNSIV
jgi:hypothetical protein